MPGMRCVKWWLQALAGAMAMCVIMLALIIVACASLAFTTVLALAAFLAPEETTMFYSSEVGGGAVEDHGGHLGRIALAFAGQLHQLLMRVPVEPEGHLDGVTGPGEDVDGGAAAVASAPSPHPVGRHLGRSFGGGGGAAVEGGFGVGRDCNGQHDVVAHMWCSRFAP